MSFIINPFLIDRNAIVSVENPVGVTVHNGTAFGSITFQPSIVARLANGTYRNVDVSYSSGSYNSAVNGSYTLTGTLSPDSPVSNPRGLTVSIIVWVLPVPYHHVDMVDKSTITGGVDNIGRITTAITAKAGNNVTQGTANLINRPSWNGEGIYFNTQGALKQTGATSFFTRFSNGGQFTIYVIFKQLAVGTTHFGPIIDAVNGSSANVGIGMYMDNRIASSRDNNILFFITKGTTPTPIAITSSADAIVQDAWNVVKVTYDGTTVRLYTSASGGAFTEVGNGTPASAFSASNPGNTLNYGNLATIGSSTGNKMYLKHVYMEDSFMSSGDRTLLDSWAQAMCLENLPVKNANIYMQVGQSNCAGRGLNSGIAAELNGNVGAMIMVPSPTPATSTPGSGSVSSDSYWSQLTLGTNQTFESVGTVHGAEMRFGYEMYEFNQNCFIVKYGVGGTPIFEQVTYNNWNLTTPTLYTQAFGLMGTAFDEIIHVFRLTPVWRGLSIMQGETDAILTGAGAVYRANWEDVINAWIDAMVALGYTIDRLRIYFWQITDVGGAAYNPTEFAAVKAAQAAFPTTYFANYPSRTANVRDIQTRTTDDISLLDTQHYDSDGQDDRGMIEFNYFKIWANE